MKGLKNKVAIVTGGAASIGETVSRVLHANGVKIVIAARSPDVGSALAQELGEGAHFCRADVGKDEDIANLVAVTVKTFGGIDFIVNVAAVYDDAGPDSTREQWLNSMNINVIGQAMVVREARPYLAKSENASVVNFGSISAAIAQADRWTYPVSKGAIHQLTRNMALDLAVEGIRVNTLCAGVTWSAPVAGLSHNDRELADEICRLYQPLGRAGNSEEVADGVLFLCSSHASFVTGTELTVDGGYGALGPEARESIMATMAAAAQAKYG
ncbi:MAG: NAD(P)-dependent dehydrogenase (short-subunit alcohol dehydrogenase family) [Halioglobus sp.]